MSAVEEYTMQDMPMEVNCDDLFDQIDDLLDFPNFYYDDNQPADMEHQLPTLPACKKEEGVDDTDKPMELQELDIAADLEWVSNFMDDTTDLNFTSNIVKEEAIFRTTSPVSVLFEPNKAVGSSGGRGSATSSSSSSSSFSYSSVKLTDNGRTVKVHNPITSAVPGRARSKRPRPACFSVRPQVIDLPQSVRLNEPDCFGESITPSAPKKIKITFKNPAPEIINEIAATAAVRKCMHCEITKTPQWRAGPMGPKTLCNACGVRYKSGRLFPEYRPAASPTFVPSVHSNSHKKVVEMRIQKPTPGMPSPDSCDLLNYIRRKD